MTPKQITVVDFSEIKEVSIRCRCGTSFTLPISKEVKHVPIVQHCFGCGVALWSGDHDQRFVHLLGLIRSLASWNEGENRGFDLSFSLESR
jgi:hypothetical protein